MGARPRDCGVPNANSPVCRRRVHVTKEEPKLKCWISKIRFSKEYIEQQAVGQKESCVGLILNES
jgi:hypothetical protein